jgi:chromosome segregation ATPase
MSASEIDDDTGALRAEVDRLRELVGPSEQSYADLRRELLAARDSVRGAEASLGGLRGRVVELEAALVRAQQDQEHFQQIVYNTLRSGRRRVGRAMRSRLL